MNKWSWFSNSVILVVCGAFVGYVILPGFAPALVGAPVSWGVTIVGGFILFLAIKLTAWLGRREDNA